MVPSNCILFKNFFNCKDQLQKPWQRNLYYSEVFKKKSISLKILRIKWPYIHITKILNTSYQLVYWIVVKLIRICLPSYFDFIITYWPRKQKQLRDVFSRKSYLVLREGEKVYDQQWTSVLKFEGWDFKRWYWKKLKKGKHWDSRC